MILPDAGGRVAVIGGGPRAVWALESLLRRGPGKVSAVDVVHDTAVFGTGSAYAPDQPDGLLMNVPARVVDAWPAGDGPSLTAWAGCDPDEYLPRARVGRYLAEQAATVCARLDEHLPVRRHQARVGDLEEGADGRPGWTLRGEGVPTCRYDAVLLCPGHEPTWPGALRRQHPETIPTMPVYPVERVLQHPAVRPDALVVVRGAALSAIDLVVTARRARPDVRIVLASRTGRPMHPKTSVPPDWDALALATARTRLAAGEAVPEVVAAAAASLLPDGTERVRDALATLNRPAGDPSEAQDELTTAIHAADGGPRTPQWALAQAWRELQPDLIRRQYRTSGPTLDWDPAPITWADWSAALERSSFGPPLSNARLLADAVADGAVQFTAADARTLAIERGADLLVDAVQAPAGIDSVDPDGLVGRLLTRGVLRRRPGTRGVDVMAGGAVPGHPGLAVIGRPTEGVVLGTDTLNRAVHPDPDRWADAVATAARPMTRSDQHA